MNPILRNILAVIIGVAVGAFVNGQLIGISSILVPLPEGVNPEDFESIKENIHRYEPIHFLMPFLAHALGTFIGALLTAFIAATHKKIFALAIGGLFLIGGIAAIILIGGPVWFSATDLILAYLPMAWLAGIIATRKKE